MVSLDRSQGPRKGKVPMRLYVFITVSAKLYTKIARIPSPMVPYHAPRLSNSTGSRDCRARRPSGRLCGHRISSSDLLNLGSHGLITHLQKRAGLLEGLVGRPPQCRYGPNASPPLHHMQQPTSHDQADLLGLGDDGELMLPVGVRSTVCFSMLSSALITACRLASCL